MMCNKNNTCQTTGISTSGRSGKFGTGGTLASPLPLPSIPLTSLTLSSSSPVPFPPVLPVVHFLRSRPINLARGYGERCKLPQRDLGRSPSRNCIGCILALKYDIWWHENQLTIVFAFLCKPNWRNATVFPFSLVLKGVLPKKYVGE